MSGLTIRGPLAYFTDSRLARCDEPAAIDLALPVGRATFHSAQRELDYWPQYAALTPAQRRNYLEWLAGGRREVPPELGYAFLFVYGLERRALLEGADPGEVFDEVLRLRMLYEASGLEASRSFDSYTGSFLWFLAAAYPKSIGVARVEQLARSTRYWTEESLASMLAWFAEEGLALPPWAAFAVAESLPLSQRSVVTRRVGEEFRTLFSKKYAARFPTSLSLKWGKHPLVQRYRPASAALITAEARVPNVMGVPSQFKPLSEIWNQSIDDLRRLSSVVARGAQSAETAEAWEALPAELRAGVDHPCCDAVSNLVIRETRADGRTFVGAMKLAAAVGMDTAATDKLTPGQARLLCDRTAHTGYCVEPDARLTLKGYRGDEVVALFLRMTDQEADRTRYAAASCMLRAGMAMAAADGAVHATEAAVLMQQIRQAFELGEDELRRLEALRSLLEHRPQDLSGFGRLAKALPLDQRHALGRLMLALVAADGVVTEDELRALRKAYQAMGFTKEESNAAVSSLSEPEVDEPPTVRPAPAGSAVGEPIPQPPAPVAAKGLKLNRAAIASIMNDTREVAKMLAAAMQAEANDVPPQGPAASLPATAVPHPHASPPVAPVAMRADVLAAAAGPDVAEVTDPTLPARYAAFYQLLLAKAEWTVAEAEAQARRHGHMLSGAVETLNEWAFERYGGQLFVEDGDRLLIERSLLS
ncbi:MAG TPA: TerB N-terminal domain-containing protein [Tepidisphaeraceae bacterium]|nr:TerB N-terminal domain-containing protein [Tepidisphaeraceae bacterium]